VKNKYKDVKFTAAKLNLVQQISKIAADFNKQGYEITLRQMYYQLVSKNIIPNNDGEYEKVGDIVGKARIAGLLDWDIIVDRIRHIFSFNHWENPGEIIRYFSHSYHIDTRIDQPIYVEIWCEKDALASVLEPICERHDVPLFICRGYPSITAKHDAAERLKQQEHQNPTVIYLGDHDPSGLDIPRELRESFDMFGCFFVEIRRIALTMTQIEQYSLPPNPAKRSDQSWELDALTPDVLSELVDDEIKELTDYDKLNARRELQLSHRNELREIADRYDYGDDEIEF
jgi:hypothetical protein